MSTQRAPLSEISQNMRRRPNMTAPERDQIIGMLRGGSTTGEIAAYFRRSPQAIRDLQKKFIITGTTEDRPRTGRPPILSLSQKKIIYRKVRATPKMEYLQLAKEAVFVYPDGTTSKPPSRTTLWRIIKGRGLTKYRCKKRPRLAKRHARERLLFSREWRNWRWDRRTVKFSDECSVQKGSGANTEWCFRFSWEKWKTDMISATPSGGKPAQMVWASIWLDKRSQAQRSELVIMERDPSAKRKGYSSQSYIKTLTKGLLPRWKHSQHFMQDNARIHTSRAVVAFLARHHIRVIKWPAYSPDLNPIEHLWWWLKKRMYKVYPQYNNFSVAEEEWDGFCDALKECWRQVPRVLIKKLIMSMPRRLTAVRKARGWQTKY
jgi:transposase